jgi:hypothetical protein
MRENKISGSLEYSDVRTYLSFPNYDVFLSGAPTTLSDLATGAGVEEGRVIYRNDRGMRWDGNEFFLHPAYPVEEITQFRYINRLINQRPQTWPPGQVAPTTPYATEYSTTTYSTAYPPTSVAAPVSEVIPGTTLNHGPMPSSLPFTGNAWVVQPGTVPASPPSEQISPGYPPQQRAVPTTGRVPQQR